VGEKEEQNSRLRKRLIEVRAALRVRPMAGPWCHARPVRMETN